MDRPTPEPAVRRSRWAALSVRGLLILVLVVVGLLGWRTRRAARKRKAAAAVEALGGRVIYDWQPEPGPDPPGFAPATVAHPPGPAWPTWRGSGNWTGCDWMRPSWRPGRASVP